MSKTRLLDSVQRLNLKTTRKLLETTPSLVAVTDRQGRNLLQLACSVSWSKARVARSTQARLVRYLLDRGFAIDAQVGRDKCTALFFAVAKARNPTLIKLLLDRGAQVASAPGQGMFAAGWWDDTESLALLIRAGARVDTRVGDTPFLAAWCWKRFEAAKFLARNGANVNVQDASGRTALHIGVEKAFDPAMLKWLARHGASPDIPDRDGVSARLKASRKRDKRFLAALNG
jgi:ankyrin repeat protein